MTATATVTGDEVVSDGGLNLSGIVNASLRLI